MTKRLTWKPGSTPTALRSMLRTLADHYPVVQGGRGVAMTFERQDDSSVCEIDLAGETASIRYGTDAQAARAVGALLGGLVPRGRVYRETTPFTTFGIMLDCSRNAVMTVDHVKVWLRRLALLGYNMVMLYTEDTYELPDEPYFGYQRGAYTRRELKAIDAYAAKLNIEVIPCIQTLGHLEKILRHGAYNNVRDTGSVLRVGEPRTYQLIEKMIAHWKSVVRSNRIHIGMDETHDLGRGRYLDLNGYRNGFDLFNEHLARVVKICKRHGLDPMIWSDMYFRLGCASGSYYDPATVIPRKVIGKIPAEAELVYWDYYHDDKAFYLDWIERHRAMGKEPLVGSGIWTWNKYWQDHRLTAANAVPCIEACREAGIKELFFTQWGDNGAYCDHDSAFAGMAFCADKAYGAPESTTALGKRFAAVCGGSYAGHLTASGLHDGPGGFQPNLWDDPIFETTFRRQCNDQTKKMQQVARHFASLATKLKPLRRDRATGDLGHAYLVADVLAKRYALSAKLVDAYRRKDKRRLTAVRREIAAVVTAVRAAERSFRRMWLSHNKPEGLETIQARFGMLEARYRELSRRIKEYADGAIPTIAELEYRCPPR
jgi:hexosaminidase